MKGKSLKKHIGNSQFWIGLAVSGLFLFLALRNMHWGEVWASIRTARIYLIVLSSAILYGGWVVAAYRWRVLLTPASGLRTRDAFAYIAIGYMANSVLSMRLGELARATLLGLTRRLGISRVLGSIALERVLDLLAVIAIAIVLTLAMDIPPVIQTGVVTLGTGGVGILIFLVLLAFHQERLPRVTAILSKFIPHRLAENVMALVQNFSAGAGVLRKPVGVFVVCGLSALVWGLYGLSTWLATRAFHLPVPWYGALFVLVVINLGCAIPSSPGYIGVYHYLAVLALSPWVPDRNAALAYAIGTHALSILGNVGMGSLFLAREGISLKSLKAQATNREEFGSQRTENQDQGNG